MNIQDPDADRLACEVARLAGESKTEAVRVALRERRDHLIRRQASGAGRMRLERFLEVEAWPQIPEGTRGLTPAERDEVLGFGRCGPL